MHGSVWQRYLISIALALPLAIATIAFQQFTGASTALTTTQVNAAGVLSKRPLSSAEFVPPPTLVPAPTPQPTPTSVPQPTPTAAPRAGKYVVQPGDELKHIAATYGVSIWKIIDVNALKDPDNLRVGQELKIPEN